MDKRENKEDIIWTAIVVIVLFGFFYGLLIFG